VVMLSRGFTNHGDGRPTSGQDSSAWRGAAVWRRSEEHQEIALSAGYAAVEGIFGGLPAQTRYGLTAGLDSNGADLCCISSGPPGSCGAPQRWCQTPVDYRTESGVKQCWDAGVRARRPCPLHQGASQIWPFSPSSTSANRPAGTRDRSRFQNPVFRRP
jgi:hypothetical protein